MNLLKEVTFLVSGKECSVDITKVSPGTSLNTYLREYLGLTGTKRMCVEGGCGACIVAVERKHPITGQNQTLAVNSCLVSVFSCHGWSVRTVEGIGNSKGNHPIQNILAHFNGTQCGFCSSGMVMNMYALTESGDVTMKEVENSFGGNICRCTGYRPILTAFKSLAKDASPDVIGTYPDIEELKLCKKGCLRSKCELKCTSPFYLKLGLTSWIKVFLFDDLLNVIKTSQNPNIKHTYMLVAGNTAKGVFRESSPREVYVDILDVRELVGYQTFPNKLILGGNISLTEAMELFYRISKEMTNFAYLEKLADHIDLIANVPVRNMGTIAGNLMMKHARNDFPSDIFLILETAGAQLEIVDVNKRQSFVTPQSFLRLDMTAKVIKRIILPALDSTYNYESYKIMPRAQNAHALVNAGFLLKLNQDNKVESAKLVYGCINASFIHAINTETYLTGKPLFDNKTLQGAFQTLNSELKPDFVVTDPAPEFRRQLAISLFYKFILSITPGNIISKRNVSGGRKFQRPVSSGVQDFETNESLYPLTQAIPKIEAVAQTTGRAEYIPDMPDLPNQLFAAFVLAKAPANSVIKKVDPSKALNLNGVVAFYDKNDIPGRNTFTPAGTNFPLPVEEELFCGGVVKYYFQPIGIIVANSQEVAQDATELVEISYSSGNPPLIKIKDILKADAKEKIVKEREIQPKSKGNNVKHAVNGTFNVSWQYHYHMETHCCNVVPVEDGLTMFPSTQWMDGAQVSAAAVLNLPANRINISIRRLGGSFGAKISRGLLISSATALAAHKLNKPVKMWLSMETNMNVVGKRFPLSSTYEVAVDEKGIVQHLNNTFYYDYGYAGNDPCYFLVMETYLECYNTDTWYTDSYTTRTDTSPCCWIRAPGSTEGLAMSEAIMEHIAMEAGIDPLELKLANINREKNMKLIEHIQELREWADIDSRKREIQQFNTENRWRKRGISVVPMVFPFNIFFSYNVLISVYQSDGTVALSHGGVEMGQGINTKAAQVCAYKLGINLEDVSVKPSNNLVAPNNGITAASLTSEGVCFGVIKACDELLARMKPVRDKMNNPTWKELVKECFRQLVNLSVSALSTPKEPELGSYDVYGICAAEIELDVLTGLHQVTRVDLLEDVGNSMSPQIDIGQVEGAFIMGLGYFTTEQIIVSDKGEMLTNRTWNYKPPGAKDIPIDFRVKFPKNVPNKVGVLKSKATGEPPLCLAVSVPLAIRQAVASIRSEIDNTKPKWYPFDGPSTVENTFTNCLHDYKNYIL